jgi:hypothetical protein
MRRMIPVLARYGWISHLLLIATCAYVLAGVANSAARRSSATSDNEVFNIHRDREPLSDDAVLIAIHRREIPTESIHERRPTGYEGRAPDRTDRLNRVGSNRLALRLDGSRLSDDAIEREVLPAFEIRVRRRADFE